MKISGTIEGLDIVVGGLENASLDVREAAFQGVLIALNAAFKACAAMLSIHDHTLKELALMGHPYAQAVGKTYDVGFNSRRRIANRGATFGPQQIHTPDELVHYQSGAYRDALRKTSPQGYDGVVAAGEISIDDSMAELDRWIQEGTVHMRGRPWMKYVVDNYGEDFADIIEASIDEALKKLGGR